MFSNTKELDIFDACALYVRGDFEKALKAFEEFYALNPDSVVSLNFIGDIYAFKGEKIRSAAAFNKLINKFIDAEEYDKALSVIFKLKRITSHPEVVYRQISDVYLKKHRERLSAHYLMVLADKLREQGKFKECAEVYTQVADENRTNYRIISRVITRLTADGNFRVMSSVLQKSVNSNILPPAEIDNFVQHMIDSNCTYEYLAPFMPDFLRRNPDKFSECENILVDMFRNGFDGELFNSIVANMPLDETVNFTKALMEYVPDGTVVMHMLRISAFDHDTDNIKGLVMRLFVDNFMDMEKIYAISLDADNPVPMEEALKVAATTSSKNDVLAYMAILQKLYDKLNMSGPAVKFATALQKSSVPLDMSAFIAQDNTKEEPIILSSSEPEPAVAEEQEQPVPEQKVELSNDFGTSEDTKDVEPQKIDGLEQTAFAGFGDENETAPKVATDDFFSGLGSGTAVADQHVDTDDFFAPAQEDAKQTDAPAAEKAQEPEPVRKKDEQEDTAKDDFFTQEIGS